MNLFGFGKVRGDMLPRLVQLELEVSKLQSALRQLELEQQTVHDQVRKWMRRAVAAERAAGSAEPDTPIETVTADTPLRTVKTTWGARARIAARRAARPADSPEDQVNGVHP